MPRQLGDVVVCPEVVGDEWRGPLVHALLHLLGYDHGDAMERREQEILGGRRVSPIPGRRPPSLLDSFNYAFEGIIHVLRTQRNLRIHFLVAGAVFIAALAVDVSRIELIVLLLAIAFVLVAEMINSAIEGAVDVSSTSFDPNAKLAKDIAAGAVLIASVNAVAVGYLVFSGQVGRPLEPVPRPASQRAGRDHARRARPGRRARDRDEGVAGRGTPLRGGLPSGHAAVAFAGWMAVDAHPRRVRPSLPRLVAHVHHGAARRADARRVGRPFHARGRHGRYPRRHRDPRHLPGVRGMTDEELLARADAIAVRAYAPYSNFRVGCAVLTRDGSVVEGVNVENAAYPLGVCAERTTFSRAVVEGVRPGDFTVAAITASPCGGCRQWLAEMQVERVVFRNGGRIVRMTVDELLPEQFDAGELA